MSSASRSRCAGCKAQRCSRRRARVQNAATFGGTNARFANLDFDLWRVAFETNVLGSIRVAMRLWPNVLRSRGTKDRLLVEPCGASSVVHGEHVVCVRVDESGIERRGAVLGARSCGAGRDRGAPQPGSREVGHRRCSRSDDGRGECACNVMGDRPSRSGARRTVLALRRHRTPAVSRSCQRVVCLGLGASTPRAIATPWQNHVGPAGLCEGSWSSELS